MASITLKNISKIYDKSVKAVSNFCMHIQDKEFIVFVGPSGCGKSTTLRMIAGLEKITEGELYINDDLVNDVEPKDRDIAMVFQNYALYPHMTVYDNMAFSLKLKKRPKKEIYQRVMDVAKILDIEDYLRRKPKALSGGQRQRVALGRAIVRNPKVFLLDEPLSNLDAKLRASMRTEITKLHDRLQTTFVYVTHDQTEAMTMGTRIVVMKDGFVQQIDTPQNLYDYPYNKFVASFIGTPQMNFFEGKIDKTGIISINGDKIIKTPKNFSSDLNLTNLNDSGEIVLGIRAENLALCEKSDENSFNVKIEVLEALGSETMLMGKLIDFANTNFEDEKIGANGNTVIARIDTRSKVKRGDIVSLKIDVSRLHLFDKKSEISLYKNAKSNLENDYADNAEQLKLDKVEPEGQNVIK